MSLELVIGVILSPWYLENYVFLKSNLVDQVSVLLT
jgi:hypothetical protein